MALETWSTTAADNDDSTLAAGIDWRENQAPSTVNNSARQMMADVAVWYAQIQGGTNYIAPASVAGTADAITLATTDGIAAYAAGQRFVFVAESANTGAVTVNVDSLGTRAVKSHGEPLTADAWAIGDVIIIVDDGTDYELVYPRRQIGVDFELVSDDAGAGAGPDLSLYRNSASPAANDQLGSVTWYGEDSAGNKTQLAQIVLEYQDVTSTSEDSLLKIRTTRNATDANRVLIGDGLYTTNATGGDQGADTVNATDYYRDGVLMGGTLVAVVEDQKTSGTDGGTFSNGADRTRNLNTEVFDLASVVSVGSNQITLAAGDYIIKWSAPAYEVGNHQTLLYDVTGIAEVARGTSEFSNTVNDVGTRSFGAARVTPGSSNVYEIRHRCSDSKTTLGFGAAGGFGTEVYTRVEIYAV